MTVKNRGWVKNAAIIFLSVLLVLTFFSNTILNYSLPEVAGQYASYAEIKSAIRGQGTVVANMSYNVELGETRQIAKVHIKSGQYVMAGEVLFTLEESESEELKQAIKTLDSLVLAYNKKLLQMTPVDYDDENRTIATMQEELQELVNQKDKIAGYAEALEKAKANVKAAEARVESLLKEQTAIEEDITALGSTDEYDYKDLLNDSLKALNADIEKAVTAQEDAQAALEKAETDLENNSGGGGNASAIKEQITAKQEQITSLMLEAEGIKQDIMAMADASSESRYDGYQAAKADYVATPNDTTKAAYDSEVSRLLSPSFHAEGSAIQTMAASYVSQQSGISEAERQLQNLEADYYNATSSGSSYYKDRVTQAKNTLAKATEKVNNLKKQFERGMKELTTEYKDKLSAKKSQVKDANEVLADAQEAKTEAEANAAIKPDELEKQIKAKQKDIENKLYDLAKQKDSDRVTQQIAELDMETERKGIEEQEQIVEKLREKAEASEVTSKHDGIVTAVSCIVGEKVQAGSSLASIDVEGKGFTTSFSVTNEQAQKVRVGDTTTISQWWGEGVTLTVTAIRSDPQNPGKSKVLDFSVEGDVSAGQTLSISIGERNQSYECVLPNSAIREDANGTFILVAEEKRTPLGTRYMATRVDVSVLAKDDMNTAISRDNYNYDFVITTATKPVEPGTQVRLVDR